MRTLYFSSLVRLVGTVEAMSYETEKLNVNMKQIGIS